jgi:hypothetical protein
MKKAGARIFIFAVVCFGSTGARAADAKMEKKQMKSEQWLKARCRRFTNWIQKLNLLSKVRQVCSLQ